MANDLGQKGIWADLLRAASNIFRTPEDQEDPMKELRGMIETGELGGAELGGAVFPGAGFIGTIGRVGARTKTPMARFLKRVLERSMKGFQGPAAAKPVVGEVVKKIAPVHKQLPMPSYQEVWRREYLKALKGVKEEAPGKLLSREEFYTKYPPISTKNLPYDISTKRGQRHAVEFIESVTHGKKGKEKIGKILNLMDQDIYSYKDYIKKGVK